MNCLDCIKSVTGSKTQNGITLNIVGYFKEIPPILKVGSHELKLKSVNKVSNLLYSYTYSTDFSYRIQGNVRFKVIPKSVYDALSKYNQLAKLTADMSPVSYPAKIFIKVADDETDYYAQNTGFTPDEIFKVFGINVIYPPSLKYRITELDIRSGLSIAALIHTIFPVPGSINFLSKDTIEFSIAPHIIVDRTNIFNSESIEVTTSETYNFLVMGMQSEPRNITSEFGDSSTPETITAIDENGNVVEMEVIKNKLGKVYKITKETYTIKKLEVPSLDYLENLLGES